ncbi:MAG: arsenate reductase family protein [Bryobacteraceae bacterium]
MDAEVVELSTGPRIEELGRLTGRRDNREFLNPKNELYRRMGLKTSPPPRAEVLRLLSEKPNRIRRPILARGSKVLVGFSEGQWREA